MTRHRWRIAVHEAGHAVAALRRLKATNSPSASSPMPNRVAALHIRQALRSDPIVTRRPAGADHWLGAQREEVFLGDVSAGAGGRATSDLAKASMLALDAIASYGLSRVRKPVLASARRRKHCACACSSARRG